MNKYNVKKHEQVKYSTLKKHAYSIQGVLKENVLQIPEHWKLKLWS